MIGPFLKGELKYAAIESREDDRFFMDYGICAGDWR